MSDDFDTFEDGEDSLIINMEEVEAQSFEAIPKGKYPVVVEDVQFQISKSSNKPMFNVRFSITEGEFANRKLFTYMSFSEKALAVTKANIAALAPDLITTSFNPKKVADESLLIGKTAIASVGIEKDQSGDDRNTVKKITPDSSGGGDDFM